MRKNRFLSGTELKYLAILAMTVDHIALVFIAPDSTLYYCMRMFGRLTAPIMSFFIAEGFRHTRNRKKYFSRLAGFAILAQPFYFVLAFGRLPRNIFELLLNWNVMFTLAVALLVLILLTTEKLGQTMRLIAAAVCISFAQCGDWSYLIPTWTLLFFFFSKDFRKTAVLFIAASVILQTIIYMKHADSFAAFSFQYGTLLALIPLRLYNGKRGGEKHKALNRWLFYIYYPLHMAALILIRAILN